MKWAGCSGAAQPIKHIFGALNCVVKANGICLVAVLDTASMMPLISCGFAAKHGMPVFGWEGSWIQGVNDVKFKVSQCAEVTIEVLSWAAKGKWGLVPSSLFDILLGLDFLSRILS